MGELTEFHVSRAREILETTMYKLWQDVIRREGKLMPDLLLVGPELFAAIQMGFSRSGPENFGLKLPVSSRDAWTWLGVPLLMCPWMDPLDIVLYEKKEWE